MKARKPIDFEELATEDVIARMCGTEPPEMPTIEAAILLESTREAAEAIVAFSMPIEPSARSKS